MGVTERKRNPTEAEQIDTATSGVIPRVRGGSHSSDTIDVLRAALERERALRLDAERRLDAQTRWVAGVSHEMRSTLTAILVWSDVIGGEVSPPHHVSVGLGAIGHNARRQLRLAEDLLDYGAASAGRLSVRRDAIDLRSVVTNALTTLEPSAASRQVTVNANFASDSAMIAGDPDRLEQVLLNILWNALNHTPAGGKIDIELSQIRSRYRLTVLDTGAGIEASALATIFEPFQARPASKSLRVSRGAGLGLAVAKQIVEAHGGDISVVSEGAGHGTMVTLLLPSRLAT